ncbi:MAG: MBL fold metallo-hydrolase [Pseudomonadota bacterium]|nr:MBL fold metallo-hydrolase [Pseudomonadota bacterium]
MSKWNFTKGLHDLGNGSWAYLQPDGGWGWSNAGLIADSGETLLVDTLFDLPLTAEMLSAMRDAVPDAKAIDTLVNTHANGDHTYGNQLVDGAEIVASANCAAEMKIRPPEAFISRVNTWQDMGDAGAIIWELMGRHFDFDGIENRIPTRTFDRELTMMVGDKKLELTNVGPAHTRGDVLVHVPKDKTVFTGDIVFVGGHPVMWSGPVGNWISACDHILGLDVETVVPGHGPISGKGEVHALRSYLTELRDAARKRYDAGLDWVSASEEIVVDFFNHWIDRERVFINVNSLYREFNNDEKPPAAMKVFAEMAKWYWSEYPDRHPHGNCTGH